MFTWCKKASASQRENIIPRMKGNGGNIIVWDSLIEKGNSDVYQGVLQSHVMSELQVRTHCLSQSAQTLKQVDTPLLSIHSAHQKVQEIFTMFSVFLLCFSPLWNWGYMHNALFLIMWWPLFWCAVKKRLLWCALSATLCLHAHHPSPKPYGLFSQVRICLTVTISCRVQHVWRHNSIQCPDLILQTLSGVHVWKQLKSNLGTVAKGCSTRC